MRTGQWPALINRDGILSFGYQEVIEVWNGKKDNYWYSTVL